MSAGSSPKAKAAEAAARVQGVARIAVSAPEKVATEGVVPRLKCVRPQRQAEIPSAEQTESENDQHRDNRPDEHPSLNNPPQVNFFSTSTSTASTAKTLTRPRLKTKPSAETFAAVMLRDFIKPDRLQRQNRQHAGHDVEEQARKKRDPSAWRTTIAAYRCRPLAVS